MTLTDTLTVSTKLGLVHAVVTDSPQGLLTKCKRYYVHTPIDQSPKTVTCLWCVTNQKWPVSVTVDSLLHRLE